MKGRDNDGMLCVPGCRPLKCGRRSSGLERHHEAAVLERLFRIKSRPGYSKGAWVRDVSVVIPVRNEEHRLILCLKSVMSDSCVREVIVVDGGSSDRTRQVAKALGVRMIVHDAPPEKGGGRGGQIRKGVMAAEGDVVAVVHADTRVDPLTFRIILDTLRRNPLVVGGAAGTRFDDDYPGIKVIEYLNALRATLFRISFGDQIQFFRKKAIVENDLFPNIPLMEDVELSLRMNRLGRTVYLFGNSLVSARRWKEKGFRNALHILFYFFSYLFHRFFTVPDAVRIYRKYYGVKDVPLCPFQEQ